jgi:hypothetical protein
MSLRQLSQHVRLHTIVTDVHGNRRGRLLAKDEHWCWVLWEDDNSPSTEHESDLWLFQDDVHASNRLENLMHRTYSTQLANR